MGSYFGAVSHSEPRLEIGLEQDLQGLLYLHGATGQLGNLSTAKVKQFDIAQDSPRV